MTTLFPADDPEKAPFAGILPAKPAPFFLAEGEGEKSVAFDTLFTVLLSADETDSQYGVFTSIGAKGDRIPAHHHPRTHEIFFVVDGNLFFNSTMDLENVFHNFEKVEHDPATIRVEINAHQWAWDTRSAGPDGKFNTKDDIVSLNDLRIPVDTPVIFEVASTDVLHAFNLPNFRAKVDAVPGQVNRMWTQAKTVGDCFREGQPDAIIAKIMGAYREVIARFRAYNATAPVLMHNYDYAWPTGKGVFGPSDWLKQPMDRAKVPKVLRRDVFRALLDRLRGFRLGLKDNGLRGRRQRNGHIPVGREQLRSTAGIGGRSGSPTGCRDCRDWTASGDVRCQGSNRDDADRLPCRGGPCPARSGREPSSSGRQSDRRDLFGCRARAKAPGIAA